MPRAPIFALALTAVLVAAVYVSSASCSPIERRERPSVAPSYRHIMLRSGSIDTASVAPASLPSPGDGVTTRALAEEPKLYLLHMDGPIRAAAKERVNAALSPYGLGKYIPHNTFMVYAPAIVLASAADACPDDILWVGEFEPESRVVPDLSGAVAAYTAKVAQLRSRAVRGSEGGDVPEQDSSVELFVVLTRLPSAPRTTLEEAAAVARAFTDLPATATVKAVSPNKLSVLCAEPSEVPAVAAVLSRYALVEYVEVAPVYEELNAHTRLLIQANITTSPFNAVHPFFDAGVDGSGQVVGVGDSGLDVDHCYFYDADESVEFSKNGKDKNNNHRKVVHYNNYVDSIDESTTNGGGHGTHVAGAVAGKAFNGQAGDVDHYDGSAPKAKLAFFDLGNSNNPGAINTPGDLGSGMFAKAYDAGARIHTNSWGASPVSGSNKSPTAYTSNSAECDEYVDGQKNFLILFAAGNDGDEGSKTIGSPGTAKNVLTVGATQNTLKSWRDLCCLDAESVCVTSSCNALTLTDIANEEYGEHNMAYFSSRGPLSGDGRIKPEVSAPGYWSVSSKSNGASTTNQCDGLDSDALVEMAGTSMATPAVAGTAALVRQYLEDGYYPTGTKVSTDKLKPKASLLKAILMGGAVPMDGQHGSDNLANKDVPNSYYGFGRVNLPTSLYLPATAAPDWGMVILSNEDYRLETDSWVKHCFETVTGTGLELEATLVWTDPFGSVSSDTALINNLDMVLTAGKGTKVKADDDSNNFEYATLSPVTVDEVCVEVQYTNIPEGPQSYSLVVSGPVTGSTKADEVYDVAGEEGFLNGLTIPGLTQTESLYVLVVLVLFCCCCACMVRCILGGDEKEAGEDGAAAEYSYYSESEGPNGAYEFASI